MRRRPQMLNIKNNVGIGEEALDFIAETWKREPISLKDFRGSKVWLAFFRYAACPLCNLRVHDMAQKNAMYEHAGLKIIAVFQSPPEKMAEYVGKQDPPFPMVSDPSEKLYKLYGLGSSPVGFLSPGLMRKVAKSFKSGVLKLGSPDGTVDRIPGDFLIDENGIVRDIFNGADIGDHIPFDRVNAFAGV